jgi:hypothetical protein
MGLPAVSSGKIKFFEGSLKRTSAIIPGTIIRNGRNIFGKAPINGTFLAAILDSAAKAL